MGLSRTVWPQSTILTDDRQTDDDRQTQFSNTDSWLASHESAKTDETLLQATFSDGVVIRLL